MTLVKSLLLFVVLALAAPLRAEVALVMVEQPGCTWCARWNAEVGDAYPLTAEGRIAPLRRVDLRAPPPDGIVFDRPAVYTPTFVLVSHGREVGRIEGYPGEDFFWPLLARLIGQLPPEDRKDPTP